MLRKRHREGTSGTSEPKNLLFAIGETNVIILAASPAGPDPFLFETLISPWYYPAPRVWLK